MARPPKEYQAFTSLMDRLLRVLKAGFDREKPSTRRKMNDGTS
jgi:hypothetical protein